MKNKSNIPPSLGEGAQSLRTEKAHKALLVRRSTRRTSDTIEAPLLSLTVSG